MTFHKNPISLSVLFVSIAFLLVAGPLQSTSAQTEKLKRLLESIDADGDGDIDQRELSPRIEKYLQAQGVDTSRSPSIRKILKRVEDKTESAASQNIKPQAQLKVPGFGVEQGQSQGQLLGFSNEPRRKVDPKIAERAKKRALETLGRYDKNRDNILNQEETKSARWGSPSPQEHDANGDGMLSLNELSRRYEDRYIAEQKERERRDNERSDEKRKEGDRKGKDDNGSGRQLGLNNLNAKFKLSTASTIPKSSPASTSDDSKYEKYAAGLITRYDKNKNGWLDKDEVAKMHRPPKSDPNNDGRITKAELIALNAPKGAVNSRSTTSKRSSSKGTSGGRVSSKSSTVLGGKDKNQDQHIQMNEFADRWTEKTVSEFNKLDANGDAVISVEEWLKK